MTIDQANTALAIASTRQQRLAALNALALAAHKAADELNAPKECPTCGDPHWRTLGCVCNKNDESEGYQLQTRLIEARNVLTMAVQHIENTWPDGKGHHVPNTLELAIDHIQAAIESL